MDFSILDLGMSSRQAPGSKAEGSVLDSEFNAFSSMLTESAERPAFDDLYDDFDQLDAIDADENRDDNEDYDDEAGANDRAGDEQAGNGQAGAEEPIALAADANADMVTDPATSEQAHTATAPTGTSTAGAQSATIVQTASAAAVPGIAVNSAKVAATLAEAGVLQRRAQAINANTEHAAGQKAQLARAETTANAAGTRPVETQPPATAEPAPSKTPVERVEQALRNAFPQNLVAQPASSHGAAAQPSASPISDALTMATAGDSSTEANTALQTGADRANNVAASKSAAMRTPFNLPGARPAEQVSVQIQNAVRDGNDRINIRLSPASMGKVEVKLELAPDKTVQAIVIAEKPETLDILERDARTLQRALEEAGLRTNSDSLSFERRDQSAMADKGDDFAGDSSDRAGTSGNGELADDGDLISELETPSRRHHDGLLDVEV